MNITWYGQSCFKIEAKSRNEDVTIVVDPFDPKKTGLKLPRSMSADIVLQTTNSTNYPIQGKDGQKPFVINMPGEYEVKGIFIYAIPVAQHNGKAEYTFWVEIEDIVLVHAGALDHVPTEAELQSVEGVDVLCLPVGGNGVLDAKKASQLISELQPRLVIPMLYKLPGLKEKRDTVDAFLKSVGSKSEQMPKLKLVRKNLPIDEMKVVVLEKA